MNTAAEAVLSERRMVAAGLRLSVGMLDQTEQALAGAAIELVIRTRHGEFADPGWPWVVEGDSSDPLGLFRLNADAMTAWNHGRPTHPVMAFVEALAGGRPVRQLGRLLSLLVDPERRLVLTAFRYAARGRQDVAEYAYGGNPWQMIYNQRDSDWQDLSVDVVAELRFWSTCEPARHDQPTLVMRPRLKVAGGAR